MKNIQHLKEFTYSPNYLYGMLNIGMQDFTYSPNCLSRMLNM